MAYYNECLHILGWKSSVSLDLYSPKFEYISMLYTVKKFDEVVRHLHLVTKDQFSLVSKKDSGIHEDNCNINIEVFLQTFTNVELLSYKHIPNVELFR
jgi:hypothetical protein